jgi:outer membrane protein assembly factor BamA
LPAGDPARPGAGCSAQSINDGSCDLSAFVEAYPRAMVEQPVGGSVSLEGNVEVRYPIWADQLRGAVFLDFGQVWRDSREFQPGDVQFTPGMGIRYFSPVGPIRIDVGYNPGRQERLSVMTTEVCDARVTPCGPILPGETYDAADLSSRRTLRALPDVAWRPHRSLWERLQFHFSIGQAF